MKYEIKVQLKSDVLNVEAKEILRAIHSQGFSDVKSLVMAKSFVIETNYVGEDVEKIAKNILTNEIIEDYSIHKIND